MQIISFLFVLVGVLRSIFPVFVCVQGTSGGVASGAHYLPWSSCILPALYAKPLSGITAVQSLILIGVGIGLLTSTRGGNAQATTGLIVLIAVVLFAWGVWPTPYRYDHLVRPDGTSPVRMHRISGRAEILCPNGWVSAGAQSCFK